MLTQYSILDINYPIDKVVVTVTFKEQYMELKSKGLSDGDIARSMCISLSVLKSKKKIAGLVGLPLPNKQGVTEEQLQQAESIGIPRRLVLARIRSKWSVRNAISTPKGNQGIKRGCNNGKGISV